MQLQQFVDGVTTAGIYAMASLGLALIYRILGFMQISHGQMVTLSAYCGYYLVSKGVSVPLALALTIVGMGCLGYGLQHFVFDRLVGKPHLVPLLVALGLGLIVSEALRLLVNGGNPVHYERNLIGNNQPWHLPGNVYLAPSQLLMLALAVVLVIGAHLLLVHTRVGTKLRAVAANREAAEVIGIDTRKMFGVVMAVSFATAAVAGVVIASNFAYVSPTFGDSLGFIALAIVLFAGLGSIAGILVAATILGLVDSFATAVGLSSYSAMLPFVVIMLILIVRPTGLFGGLMQERN